jgi:predicted Zn-dependent protease
MEEKISGRMRNMMVYSLLGLTIVGLAILVVIGNKQDEKYKKENELYQVAQSQLREAKFNEAEKNLEQLLANHSNNYNLQWQYALSLAAQQKYDQASKYFLKAQQQRPFLVRDQKFVMQFGEVLYHQGNYAKAKRYLEEGKRINTDPELSLKVDPLLNDINSKIGKSN